MAAFLTGPPSCDLYKGARCAIDRLGTRGPELECARDQSEGLLLLVLIGNAPHPPHGEPEPR